MPPKPDNTPKKVYSRSAKRKQSSEVATTSTHYEEPNATNTASTSLKDQPVVEATNEPAVELDAGPLVDADDEQLPPVPTFTNPQDELLGVLQGNGIYVIPDALLNDANGQPITEVLIGEQMVSVFEIPLLADILAYRTNPLALVAQLQDSSKAQFVQMQKELQKMQKTYDAFKKVYNRIFEKYEEAKHKIAQHEAVVANMKAEIEGLKQQNSSSDALQVVEAKLRDAEALMAAFQSERADLRAQVTELKNKQTALEAQLLCANADLDEARILGSKPVAKAEAYDPSVSSTAVASTVDVVKTSATSSTAPTRPGDDDDNDDAYRDDNDRLSQAKKRSRHDEESGRHRSSHSYNSSRRSTSVDLEEELRHKNNIIAELQREIRFKDKNTDKLREIVQNQKRNNTNMGAGLRAAQAETDRAVQSERRLLTELDRLQNECAALRESLSSQPRYSASSSNAATQQQYAALLEQCRELQVKVLTLEPQLTLKDQLIESHNANIRNLQDTITRLKADYENLYNRYKALTKNNSNGMSQQFFQPAQPTQTAPSAFRQSTPAPNDPRIASTSQQRQSPSVNMMGQLNELSNQLNQLQPTLRSGPGPRQ